MRTIGYVRYGERCDVLLSDIFRLEVERIRLSATERKKKQQEKELRRRKGLRDLPINHHHHLPRGHLSLSCDTL